MKNILNLFLFFTTTSILFGQSTNREVAFGVLTHVNNLRDSLNLPKLIIDDVLNLAADDHAYYIAQKGDITHFQKTFSKETPAERVLYYKGNRTYIGENVAYVSAKKKSSNSLDYSIIALELYTAWFHSPPHFENMIDARFTKMGLGICQIGDQIYGTQVFSSNEIRLPGAFRNSEIAWGIRPGEFNCKNDDHVYETMLFANSVEIDGRNIYLFFHDLSFFNHVIENDNDGLAIDVVLREQLPCGKENQFHISKIYDGEMQRPIYKNDIYRNNISSNPKKIKVKIGEVPTYLANKQWEANVIIFKNNVLCDYSIPIEVPSDIYPLLEVEHFFEIETANQKAPKRIHIKDSIHVGLDYERSHKRFTTYDVLQFQKLLDWGRFAKDLKVDCFASVEGEEWYNHQLLAERTKSVTGLLERNFISTDKIQISAEENWKSMRQQINQHQLLVIVGKNEKEIKYYFKKHKSALNDSLLFEQRKTHIYAIIDTVMDVTTYNDYLVANSYNSSFNLNDLPWNSVLVEDYIKTETPIESAIFDSLYTDSRLRTNLLAASCFEYVNGRFDSTSVELFLKDVDLKNSKQVFNYVNFTTRYWFSKFSNSYELKGVAKTKTPEEIMKMLNNLDSTIISLTNLNRLKVNVLLSGIHYYVTYDNWRLVNQYFDQISELVKSVGFTSKEAVELALFCNHFHKFKQAIDILDPFYSQNELDEYGIFVLAKTATLIRDQLNSDQYHLYMKSAKDVNRVKYCDWLNTQFQIQRDEYIKIDFCKECR